MFDTTGSRVADILLGSRLPKLHLWAEVVRSPGLPTRGQAECHCVWKRFKRFTWYSV